MAGVTAHGGTFTFVTSDASLLATITGLSIETPQAEVVDMTAWDEDFSIARMVPTGCWTGGSASVDYIHAQGGTDPHSLVRKAGSLSFSSAGYSVTRQAVLESATAQASTGDIVKGTLKFRFTDYTE